MDIGKTIAKLRKEAGLSQAELAVRLSMLGVDVTNQAVSKWESGSSVPNARQFIILCAALGVEDVLGEFTKGKYGAYAGLDSEGRRKLAEYKSLLISSGRYSIKKAPPHPVRTLPLYSLAVSAGTGQFLDGENYEMVEVGAEVPEGANFGVRVAGDSMEPEYHDGQIVWVRQQRSLMTGETGIFLYDGCAYLKRLAAREDRMALRSLNPAYADILISPELPLRVLGKVLN
ncbi:MAG: LexA family transcriptional regulator [Oscillospiraceae bacterium]|nr:LexA family transcriptional regulator [Oscillospiraceae bacterium]